MGPSSANTVISKYFVQISNRLTKSTVAVLSLSSCGWTPQSSPAAADDSRRLLCELSAVVHESVLHL